MATAADVPTRFDLLVDGQGYVFADEQEVKAEYGIAPTFVTRQNVQGDYGDNQQDFWLTATQRDWSLGEQQRYYRQADDDSKRRYWQGTNVDIRVPGRVTLREALASIAAAANILSVAPLGGALSGDLNYFATSTNVYKVDSAGTITDLGAHGCAGSPGPFNLIAFQTTAQPRVYVSALASTIGGLLRAYNGVTWSTFSSTPGDDLCYLNNTLYAMNRATGLLRYDTAGVATTLYTWKGPATEATAGGASCLKPYGGKLAIGLEGPLGAELWIYDGTAPTMAAVFPRSFELTSIEVVAGTIFVAGYFIRPGTNNQKPAIFYYANGTLGELWRADNYVSSASKSAAPALASWDGGLAFTDADSGRLMYYNPGSGGVHGLASKTVTTGQALLAANLALLSANAGATAASLFPSSSTASSATITTSLDDFDSSLDKRFHAIRIDYDEASDGDGGSADVAYRLNDVDGSYTSLATGVTSGQEVLLTNITGRAISIKVTLNKGTSTSGPTLKRIALRGSPMQPAPAGQPGYVHTTYILNCTGTKREPDSLIILRDGSQHGLTGLEMVANLRAAVGDVVTMIDAVNGTFSAIIDADNLKIQAVRRDEFIVQLPVRGV